MRCTLYALSYIPALIILLFIFPHPWQRDGRRQVDVTAENQAFDVAPHQNVVDDIVRDLLDELLVLLPPLQYLLTLLLLAQVHYLAGHEHLADVRDILRGIFEGELQRSLLRLSNREILNRLYAGYRDVVVHVELGKRLFRRVLLCNNLVEGESYDAHSN